MKTPKIYRGIHPDDDIVPLRRRKVLEVLKRNFRDGGINITTRRFNLILTELGFRLED